MINNLLLISIVVFSIVLSGLFSGAETGIYQLSRLRLRLGIEKKRLSFVILGKIMHDSYGLLISILVGTNLMHYLATSIITYMLLSKLGSAHAAELFATLLIAPILFVFSELIPKSIFYYHADSITPYTAPVLFAFHKFFSWCGIVPLLKFVSRSFARLAGSPVHPQTAISVAMRPHIRAIFQETHDEGFISSVQADMINRLTNISYTSIRFVMTPINKVQAVDVNSGKSALLNKLKKHAFTRLPVIDRWPANIIGFINIYEVLSSPEEFANLYDFVKPVRTLSCNTNVLDAINIMQNEKQKIVLVERTAHPGRKKPIGIITMKDLVEELLGELSEW